MRTPTPESELYDWHRRALAGEKPPVWEAEPQCGWFVRSFSDRGTLFPAMIFVEREICEETGELLSDEKLRCITAQPGDGWPSIAGHDVDPYETWIDLAKRPISKEEYHCLMHQVLFSEKYIGPIRAFVRWFDEREIAGDFFRYQGVLNAIGTDRPIGDGAMQGAGRNEVSREVEREPIF